MTRLQLASALLLATALASCGGGGPNVPTPPPAPSNSAPDVTVAVGASAVAENATGVVAEASATDADGDAVTLSLSGDDATQFTLDPATGDISFAAAPDFETPGDTDGDNVYSATVEASDGNGGTDSAAFEITVTDLAPLPIFLEVASGFSQPVYAEELSGTGGQILVLEKTGRARLVDPATGVINATDFLDARGTISDVGEGGLLGFAVAPDYATSGDIYFHVNNLAGDTEIRRYTLAAGATDRVDPASAEVIIQVGQPLNNHNAGSIGFDGNGLLIIPLGDGGGAGDPNGFSQNTQSLLGKVLRLDVSGDAFPADANRNYIIPPGNTFINPADGLPEIYAIGLRNPFRSSFDPATGDLMIADVGQDEREEINRLPMDDSSFNFGWNVREGTLRFTGADSAAFTGPIAEYEHGNGPTQGNSITGGVVYEGEPGGLATGYIFADFSSANIWTIPADTANGPSPLFGTDFTLLNDNLLVGSERPNGVTGFSVASDGTLYLTTIDGNLYRLEERE